MPVNLSGVKANIGKIVFGWTVNEYEKHERNKRWYVLAVLFGAALLIFAIASGNYLFALIVTLFGIILFLQDMLQPMEVLFAVTETGIVVGNKFYPFKEVASYWVIYNPPEVKTLYFSTRNILKHRLQVPLLDNDPRPIKDFLSQFLMEDIEQEEEPLSDRLGRVFKLH